MFGRGFRARCGRGRSADAGDALLPLALDAAEAVRAKLASVGKELEEWHAVTVSTDFPPES